MANVNVKICTAFVLFAVFFVAHIEEVQSSCKDAGLCCSGRNNSCVAKGEKSKENELKVFGIGSQDCFCDAGCKKMGDCCKDYVSVCEVHNPPVDCAVSEFRPYGSCSKLCGFGEKTRRREVIRAPRNGGKTCPPLVETRVCIGNDCKFPRDFRRREERETGRILPAGYGSWRKHKNYDFSKDIRKNLFYKYHFQNAITRPSYFAKFEVIRARKSCGSSLYPWANVLKKGITVCVECQPTAMKKNLGTRCKGQGVLNRPTRWNAVNAHGCHGKWILREEHSSSCDTVDQSLDFIFV